MRGVLIILLSSLCLTGCTLLEGTSSIDEYGCDSREREEWCASRNECIVKWQSYCPLEGESVKLITTNECEKIGGFAIDYGAGKTCAEGEEVVGELAGFLSLHVCCHGENSTRIRPE